MDKVLFKVKCIELPTGKSDLTGNLHKAPFEIGKDYNVVRIDSHKGKDYILIDVDSDAYIQFWNAKYFKKV